MKLALEIGRGTKEKLCLEGDMSVSIINKMYFSAKSVFMVLYLEEIKLQIIFTTFNLKIKFF